MTHLLYALVITFGTINNGVADLYFMDPILYPTMDACEKDKMIRIDKVDRDRPWITVIRGACTPTQVEETK